MTDNTFTTLQHFQNALQPLYCQLETLNSRVQDAQSLGDKTGSHQRIKASHARATRTMPVELELELQPLPDLSDEGARLPCFENAHDWEALQTEVNEASKHFILPAAKVAWKKWALCPGNVQVVLAVAWWVVAKVFQPSNPSSPQLQSYVLWIFSSCYAHTVLKSRRDSYVSLWLDVVSAAAVRLLREAFPHQQRKLNSDLHGLVQAQLVRWTSGLLPSDLHPSPDALASSATPAPPSISPASPSATAHASSAARRAQQAPSPNLTPPAGLQPAAVTLYQRHIQQAQQEHMRQQEQEHAHQAGTAAADDGSHQPPPSLPDALCHQTQGFPQKDSINAIASGASLPPTCQWLSVDHEHRLGSSGSLMHPPRTGPSHPADTAAAAAAAAAAATAQSPSKTAPAGTLESLPGGSVGSSGRLHGTNTLPAHFQHTTTASTYQMEPHTTAQRRRSRRPARGLQPPQGVYHKHYQPHRRHQHTPSDDQDDSLSLLVVDALPGRDQQGQQGQHESQQHLLQEWQDYGNQGQGSLQPKLQPPPQQQQNQAPASSSLDALHFGSESQPQDLPPLALSRHGFPMTQLSPAMSTLLEARAAEDCSSRQAPAPPLLSSGMRHDALGANLPALRQPLHNTARSLGVPHWHESSTEGMLQQPQEHHSPQRLRSRSSSAFKKRGEGGEDPEAELQDALSYAKRAAKDSTQRAADAVARYEAHKKASRREVASIQREWRSCRDGLSNQQQSEAFNQMLADKLSGWVESWGDAGRIMKGKPQATTRVTHHHQQPGPGNKGSAGFYPKNAALPATATDAVIGSRGGASLGAAVGVRSTGVPFAGGSSASNPPGYTQMTEAAVAGVRQAGTSILAACAATARSAPPSTTRIMQPWSKMRAVEARAQDALDPARHSAADVAAHVAAAEKRALEARSKASQQAWRPQSNTEHKRGTLDVRIRTQARKAMHTVDMSMYER